MRKIYSITIIGGPQDGRCFQAEFPPSHPGFLNGSPMVVGYWDENQKESGRINYTVSEYDSESKSCKFLYVSQEKELSQC